jgi:Na+/melibiose symporter-like transporter
LSPCHCLLSDILLTDL